MTSFRPPLGLSFRSGVAAGVVLMLGALIALLVSAEIWPSDEPPHYLAEVTISGARATRIGVESIEMRDAVETITVICRGACDDVHVGDNDALYGGYAVRALGADQACMACEWFPVRRVGLLVTRALGDSGIVQTTDEAAS